MAWGRRTYGRSRHPGLHGQRLHRQTRRGVIAKIAAKRTYRKFIRKPKRAVVKAYANTVGQIAYKEKSLRPRHGRYGAGRRFGRRSLRRRY